MRLSLGLSTLGIALSLAIAVSCAKGNLVWAASPKSQTETKGGKASAEIERQLDSAEKSLGSGNADAAMTTLESVLASGGLANKQMARALYLRGVAHRKKGRQAQAIADLTSAIWLKDGLSEADRTAALKERSEVSREVGVAVAAPSAAQASGNAPAPSSTASGSTPTSSGLASLITPPSSSPFPVGGFPESAQPQRRALPRSPRSGSAAAPVTSSWQSATSVQRRESRPAARTAELSTKPPEAEPSPSAQPAPPSEESARPGWVPADGRAKANRDAGSSQSASGEGLGGFLKGLFGGSPSAPASEGKGPAWSTSTSGDGRVDRNERATSKPIATSAVTAPPAATGAYRLQVAAVRSRAEAETVAARLKKEHGGIIGSRVLDVDQTVYGNMGTFYRVRLGPFANVAEPKSVCEQLRPKGYDCLVVTQ